MKFNASSIAPYVVSLQSVYLSVYAYAYGTLPIYNGTFYVSGASSSWNSGAITWNNAPAPNATQYSRIMVNSWSIAYTWNVNGSKPFLQDNGYVYTYVLRCVRDNNPTANNVFWAMNYSTVSFWPMLQIYYYSNALEGVGLPPPASAFTIANMPLWMEYMLGINYNIEQGFIGGLVLSLIFYSAIIFAAVKFGADLDQILILSVALFTVFSIGFSWISLWVYLIILVSLLALLGRRIEW
jgi:hypothetical protein